MFDGQAPGPEFFEIDSTSGQVRLKQDLRNDPAQLKQYIVSFFYLNISM